MEGETKSLSEQQLASVQRGIAQSRAGQFAKNPPDVDADATEQLRELLLDSSADTAAADKLREQLEGQGDG